MAKSLPYIGEARDDFQSLDVVELVMELEEEFNIDLADEDAAQIHSVSDAIRSIKQRRRSSPASLAEKRRLLIPETINPAVTARAQRVAGGIIERIATAFSIAGLVALAVAYGATAHIVHPVASRQHVVESTIILADLSYVIGQSRGERHYHRIRAIRREKRLPTP